MQAQQYAEIAIDKLKNIAYDQLDTYGAHSRTQITGISSTEWQDEVTIGSEADIAGSDGAKQRIATVNVYKKGDTIPRCTLDVPLSSLSSQGSYGDNHYVKKSVYTDSYWYREYSDGWIEQGGKVQFDWSARENTYSYPVPFKNLPVVIFSTNAQWPCGIVYRLHSSTNTGFILGADSFSGLGMGINALYSYYACGF